MVGQIDREALCPAFVLSGFGSNIPKNGIWKWNSGLPNHHDDKNHRQVDY